VPAQLAQAEAAGATLTGPAHERPWGIYSGYFSDLAGYLWEIISNPGSGLAIGSQAIENPRAGSSGPRVSTLG
jgi:hypothetical protein